jgi:hypothetical protein
LGAEPLATRNPRAALLVLDMGNYGRNKLSIPETYAKLKEASTVFRFVAYHFRRSGNFIFEYDPTGAPAFAAALGERVIGLPGVVRTWSDLRTILAATPAGAHRTPKGAILVGSGSAVRRVIVVALTDPVPARFQFTGPISQRGNSVEIVAWPSDLDVVCLYNRPQKGGDVGEVTAQVLAALFDRGFASELRGTGRAMGVIADILDGRLVWG